MRYYKHIETDSLRWGDAVVDPSGFVELDVEEFNKIKALKDKEFMGIPIGEQIKRLKEEGGLVSDSEHNLPGIEFIGEKIKNSIIAGEYKWDTVLKFHKINNIDDKVSVDRLNNLIEKHGNLDHAVDVNDNVNCYCFDLYGTCNRHVYDRLKLESLIEEKYNIKVSASGLCWYPPKSYMGWHTNSNLPGKRIYIVWAKEDNKSFFRWRDSKTQEVHTKWEKKGWNINIFDAPDWHAVASWTDRISIGMQEIGA